MQHSHKHSRDEVFVLADGLDQFHQKGLVTDVTRTKTLLVLKARTKIGTSSDYTFVI